MTATIKRTTHSVSLLDGEIVEENDFGSIRRVTADNFPILARMSIKRIVINPGAMRTPHWHANATNSPTAWRALRWCRCSTTAAGSPLHHQRGGDVPHRFGQPASHREHRHRTRRVHHCFQHERPETSASAPLSER